MGGAGDRRVWLFFVSTLYYPVLVFCISLPFLLSGASISESWSLSSSMSTLPLAINSSATGFSTRPVLSIFLYYNMRIRRFLVSSMITLWCLSLGLSLFWRLLSRHKCFEILECIFFTPSFSKPKLSHYQGEWDIGAEQTLPEAGHQSAIVAGWVTVDWMFEAIVYLLYQGALLWVPERCNNFRSNIFSEKNLAFYLGKFRFSLVV